FRRDENDSSFVIPDRREGGVNDDRFFAARASEDLRIPADKFTLSGPADAVPEGGVDFIRYLPPERGPEGFSFHVGQLNSHSVERYLVDFEYGSIRVEQADELDHGVERDAGDLLAIFFAPVTRQYFCT